MLSIMNSDERMLSELTDKDGLLPEIYAVDATEPTRKPVVLNFFEKTSNYKNRWLWANLELTLKDGAKVVKAAEVRGRKEFQGGAVLNRYVATVSKTFAGGAQVTAGQTKWYVKPEGAPPRTRKTKDA